MATSAFGTIQTVLGPIPGGELGITDAHAHLIRTGGVLVDVDQDFLLDDVAAATAELEAFRRTGGRAVVEMTPTAPGRDPLLLRELSARTGVHVIATTGFVDWALASDSPVSRYSEAELADRLAGEVLDGMDAGNYAEEQPRQTAVRAGVIKISLEHEEPTERELRFIRAATHAHCRTGAPIVVHTERGRGGVALLSLLSSLSVDASAVILSHAFHAAEFVLVESLVRRGAYVVADGVGKPEYDEAKIVHWLGRLAAQGFADRLLLGLDLSRRKYWKSYGGSPGIGYLAVDLVQRLQERGLGDATIEQMLVANPATAMALRSAS